MAQEDVVILRSFSGAPVAVDTAEIAAVEWHINGSEAVTLILCSGVTMHLVVPAGYADLGARFPRPAE